MQPSNTCTKAVTTHSQAMAPNVLRCLKIVLSSGDQALNKEPVENISNSSHCSMLQEEYTVLIVIINSIFFLCSVCVCVCNVCVFIILCESRHMLCDSGGLGLTSKNFRCGSLSFTSFETKVPLYCLLSRLGAPWASGVSPFLMANLPLGPWNYRRELSCLTFMGFCRYSHLFGKHFVLTEQTPQPKFSLSFVKSAA